MGLRFLGFDFSPIELNQLRQLSDFLNRHPQSLTGYTFATLIAWQPYYHYGWAFADSDALIISCVVDPDPHRHLIQPIGPLSPELQRQILDGAAALPYPVKIVGVTTAFLEEYKDFSRRFEVAENRAVSNYVYRAQDLAQLPGRRYARKRNLLAQAAGRYQLHTAPLNAKLVESCFAVLNATSDEERPQLDGMCKMELEALQYTLHNLELLGQEGLLVTADGRPAAFSIYEPINSTTVAIHFERALRSYKGLFQVVNCEAAQVVAGRGFEFINREEDVGSQNLRDAKLSYHPVEIVPAYEMTFKA
jgi:uncharacterized protein